MRNLFILFCIFSLLAACATPTTPPPATSVSQASATPDARSATLSELIGDVNGRARPDESLAPVNVGFQIKIGGEVRTGAEARARLDFSDESIVRLSANSSYTLQAVSTADDGSVLARIKLTAGRIWVSLFGGELEVETPLGVASVRGSFAVFTYNPGDPNDPNDDVLVIDCIEGQCGVRSPNINEQMSNMERLVLGGNQTTLRFTLTGQDVQDFLNENPESQRVVATLTAAPPINTATATFTPESEQPTATSPATSAPATQATAIVPTATFTPPPTNPPANNNFQILGTHAVRPGDSLFCIGRGYGVLPSAIASANGIALNTELQTGAALQIPAVRWNNFPAGPTCGGQFVSPFAPTATPTIVPPPAASATPQGVTCPPGEFFDPQMNLCRPINPPATLTPVGDTTGPSISGLNVSPNPAGPQYKAFCTVTFVATVSDPSGVSLVDLEWQAFDQSGTPNPPTGLAVVTMTPNPRLPGVWETTFDISLPYYIADVQWTISALDNAGNSSTLAGATLRVGGCIVTF
jgi:LysM repeat protein